MCVCVDEVRLHTHTHTRTDIPCGQERAKSLHHPLLLNATRTASCSTRKEYRNCWAVPLFEKSFSSNLKRYSVHSRACVAATMKLPLLYVLCMNASINAAATDSSTWQHTNVIGNVVALPFFDR